LPYLLLFQGFMLNIRLQRTGKRGQAHFRIIIAEHTKKPKGEVLELLGYYNPHENKLEAKLDRIEYWISKGAGISPTVNNLLVNYKIWDRPKMQTWKPKKKEKTSPQNAPVKTEKAADAVPEKPAENSTVSQATVEPSPEIQLETQPEASKEQPNPTQ